MPTNCGSARPPFEGCWNSQLLYARMGENGFSRIPLFQSSESCRKVDMRPSMILIFSLLGTVLSLYCFIVNICIFYWPIEITCLCQFLLTAIGKNLSDWPSYLKKRDQIRLGTHDRIDGDAFASKTLNQYLHHVQKLTKALISFFKLCTRRRSKTMMWKNSLPLESRWKCKRKCGIVKTSSTDWKLSDASDDQKSIKWHIFLQQTPGKWRSRIAVGWWCLLGFWWQYRQ